MYGDATTQLLAHISNYNKIEQHNIMLTAGSDVGLEYLVKHLVTPTTTVYIFVPTYSYFNSLVRKMLALVLVLLVLLVSFIYPLIFTRMTTM